MFKLALDCGHSKITAGKRLLKSLDPNETREWVLNDRIGRYLKELLSKYEIQILRLDDTTGNTDVPMGERTYKANTWGADFTLSLHHNAGANGTSAGGITLHIYESATSPIPEYQRKLYDLLIKHTGLKGNRVSPLVRNNLHMIREIDGYKSILVEHGYMDSSTDVPIILSEQFARNAAKAHAEFLVTTFGLKEVNSNNMIEEKSKVKIKQTATKYMTGETIPPEKKGVEYTVMQLGHPWGVVGEGALLSDIVSWLFVKDLELVGVVQPTPPATVLKIEYDRVVAELAKTNVLLNTEKNRVIELNKTIATGKITITNLTNEVNSLKTEVAAFANANKNLTASLGAAVEQLKNNATATKTQIDALNKKISDLQAKESSYTVQIGNLNNEKTAIATELNKLKQEFIELNTTTGEFTEANAALLEKIRILESKKAELSDTIIGMQEEIAINEDDIVDFELKIKTMKEQIEGMVTLDSALAQLSATDLFIAFFKKLGKFFSTVK